MSDYVQDKGFYPAQVYRDQNTKYVLYHYQNSGSENIQECSSQKSIINFCYPIRKESGQEFNHTDEILAHLEGESTGFFLIGRNGMWHGGIHIRMQRHRGARSAARARAKLHSIMVSRRYAAWQMVRWWLTGFVRITFRSAGYPGRSAFRVLFYWSATISSRAKRKKVACIFTRCTCIWHRIPPTRRTINS